MSNNKPFEGKMEEAKEKFTNNFGEANTAFEELCALVEAFVAEKEEKRSVAQARYIRSYLFLSITCLFLRGKLPVLKKNLRNCKPSSLSSSPFSIGP